MAGRASDSGEKPDTDAESGEMLRPPVSVLPEGAVVPERNLIRPAPTRFTHELLVDEPYRFDRPSGRDEPDGVLAAGTPVAVLVEGADRCRVADASGLAVDVRRASLGELPEPL